MSATACTPVIGTVGADVPREVVLAAGALPVRLAPGTVDPRLRAEASKLLGAVDAAAVELLASILAGEADGLAGLVFSRDREASLRLYYVVRTLAARRTSLPPVHLVDLLHLPRGSTWRYDTAQLVRLAEFVAEVTGAHPTAGSLAEAVAAQTHVRAQLDVVQDARTAGRLDGVEALSLFAAAETLAPQEAAATIGAAVHAAAGRPGSTAPALFVSGSPHPCDTVYAAIEHLGCRIVGEDHDRGMLALTVDLSPADSRLSGDLDDGLRAVAQAYALRGPDSPTASAAARAAWTADAVGRTGATAVLSYVRRHDDAPLWDFPRLCEATDALGVPAVLLRDQSLTPQPDELAAALRALHRDAPPREATPR